MYLSLDTYLKSLFYGSLKRSSNFKLTLKKLNSFQIYWKYYFFQEFMELSTRWNFDLQIKLRWQIKKLFNMNIAELSADCRIICRLKNYLQIEEVFSLWMEDVSAYWRTLYRWKNCHLQVKHWFADNSSVCR